MALKEIPNMLILFSKIQNIKHLKFLSLLSIDNSMANISLNQQFKLNNIEIGLTKGKFW